MLSVSSRIWTRVTVSISYDDNNYTTGTSCRDLQAKKTFQEPQSVKEVMQIVTASHEVTFNYWSRWKGETANKVSNYLILRQYLNLSVEWLVYCRQV